MMTKIRQMSKVLFILLILAFVGMMIVEWGAGGIKRGMYVGKINGKSVKLEDYEKELSNIRENMRQSNNSQDEMSVKNAHKQTWDGMIERVVLNKYFNKFNIVVSAEEVYHYVMNMPPEQLKQYPQLQTNGVFDISKYKMAIGNDRNFFNSIYNYYRQNLPSVKLQEIVSTGAVITEAEVLEDYIANNISANADYLYVQASYFAKKVGEVSEEEALAYYNSHKKEFKQVEKRVLEYVEFPIETSSEDSQKVFIEVNRILSQLKKGANFEELASFHSDDPSAKSNNGDLGYNFLDGYVAEFREAAEKAKIGEIVGPIETQFGLHVLTVLKKKKEKNPQGEMSLKAHVKHILVKFQPSQDTRDKMQNSAQNMYDEIKKTSFNEEAKSLGLEIKVTPPFIKGNFIPGLGNVKQVVDFAFNEKEGKISRVMFVKDRSEKEKYFIVRVKSDIDEGIKDFKDVKNVCINKIKTEKRMELAYKHSLSLKELLSNKNIKDVAAEDTSGVSEGGETGSFKLNSSIPKIGKLKEINYAAINLAKVGEVYGPIKTYKGYYFIKITSRDEFKKDDFEKNRFKIRQNLLNNKQRMQFYTWWNAEKSKIKVVDQRYKFYNNI